MNEEQAFLAAIRTNPADDTTRLVYADWLEERGDRRCEFLRAVVGARTATSEADLNRHLDRLLQLRLAVSPLWVLQVDQDLAEDDVREVVFRELLGDRAASDAFLQVDQFYDPSPYLFALLVRRYREVRPQSAGEGYDGGYRDKKTGGHGIVASLQDLAWEAKDRCRVEGTLYLAPLAAQAAHSRWSVYR